MTPDVQHLSALLAAIPHGIQETNLDGVITYSNPKHHEMLGYAPGELVGMSVFDLIHTSNDKNNAKEHLKHLIAEQPEPTPYDTVSRCKDGNSLSTQVDWSYLRDDKGKLTGIISLITDITEQKVLHDKLRQERDLAQHYLDVAQFMIVVLDKAGNISLINRKACDVLGYSAEQLLNQSWFNLCLPEYQRQNVSGIFQQLMKGDSEPVEYYENTILTATGEERIISWHNILHRDPDGNICGTISSGEDITEKLLAKKEQAKLFEQLRKTQKMEAMARLTSGIAHDFNNILASILGYADLILDSLNEMGNQNELVRYITEVIDEGEKARDLITQMLAFARTSNTTDIALNPLPLIKEIAKVNQSNLPSNIEFSINAEADIPKVLIDPSQLHQAILNLLINARDALENKGGHISLSVTHVSCLHAKCQSCQQEFEGDYVEISIADDGDGIEASMLDNIFEPFFSTKESNKKSGMGLASTHEIIHEHHGHILIDSIINYGTTVRLFLPAYQSEQKTITTHTNSSTQNTELGARILIIENDVSVARLQSELLQSKGFKTDLFSDAFQAIEFFSEKPELFDCIVIDQNMPSLSGLKFSEIALQLRPEIPIILCTTDDSHDYNLIGIQGILKKPFSSEQLIVKITDSLQHK